MTTEILFQTSIDSKNKSANTSFSSEEGISAISEKMQNKCKINNISSDNDELDTNARNKGSLMSASSSEMIDKSAELSDQKVGAVSSSSFEESSDSEDKKSTTSGASSDLSSDNNKTAEIRVVGGVEFGTVGVVIRKNRVIYIRSRLFYLQNLFWGTTDEMFIKVSCKIFFLK